MNNYVPDSDADREAIIKNNPLYKEIFERRSLCNCSDCDYAAVHATTGDIPTSCQGCLHKDETGVEMKSLEGFKLARERKIKIRNIPFGKCPVHESKIQWTGLISTYFTKDGGLKVADFDAKFCPWCGAAYSRKTAEKIKNISFRSEEAR